jgi:CBS domain-containing protein
MRIEEIAVRRPVTVTPDTTIQQAARAMADHGVGCLVVTDGDVAMGIVTDRDLVVRALGERVPVDARVDSVMSTHVIAVDRNADVREVIGTFGHHAVRRLPVVDGRHLVGIVSLDDLFVALNDQLRDLTTGVTAQVMFPHANDEPPRPVAVS